MKKHQIQFLNQIKNLKIKYKNLRSEDRFNIFYALHKQNDEVNLHSRFISYLLASDSGHQKGNLFARLFFKYVLDIKDLNFLNNYEVLPNEFNKTEFLQIDILLFNKNNKHAIIIENKIYAKDSNHNESKPVGYRGQLERYYNTILSGVPDKKKHNYIADKIQIFYISVKNINPDSFKISKGNIPEDVGVNVIYYKNEIVEWLKKCVKETKDDYFLNKIINQYLILVKNMTNTNIPIEELNELKKLYSNNLETTRYIIDNFKDIKWHTVDNFFKNLKERLNEVDLGFTDVKIYPENYEERAKLITNLTHDNIDLNLGLTFLTSDKVKLYISSLSNLSWGIVDNKWADFKSHKNENIRFSDFKTEQTFNLISEEYTNEVINLIIEEILLEKENNFENLRSF